VILRWADPSSRESYRVCVCVCVSLSVINCKNHPLNVRSLGGIGRTKICLEFFAEKSIDFFLVGEVLNKVWKFYTWMQIYGHNKMDPITVVTLTVTHTQTLSCNGSSWNRVRFSEDQFLLCWAFTYRLSWNQFSLTSRAIVDSILNNAQQEGTILESKSRFTICVVQFVNHRCFKWMWSNDISERKSELNHLTRKITKFKT